MVKVLMISPKVSGIGGTAQHVRKLIEKLRNDGFVVDVLSTENTPYVRVKGLMNPSFMITSSLKALARSLRVKYDIVHGHNIPSLPALKLAKGRAKVLTLHGIYSTQIGMLHGSVAGKASKAVEARMINCVDVITCVSRACVDYYRRLFHGEVKYIPNAVDLNDMPDEAIRLFDRQVIYAGRLSYEKGVDVLLKAWGLVKCGAHLIILGDGPLRDEVLKAESRLSNLHYLGYKPRVECLKYIKGSDILLLPSREEGLPTVVLEAMALKTLVIATGIPGVREVLDEGTGVILNELTPKALADAVCEHLSGGYEGIIESAYERVAKVFNWNVVYEEYLRLYESLLSR